MAGNEPWNSSMPAPHDTTAGGTWTVIRGREIVRASILLATFTGSAAADDALQADGKILTLGVLLTDSAGNVVPKAYLWKVVQTQLGDRAVINDTVAGLPIVIIWDAANRMMVAYERAVGDETLEFDLVTP